MNLLSKNIKRKMIELGYTQAELADLVGTSQVTINRLLSGKIKQTTKIIEIAKALKCDPSWLLTGDGSPHTPEFDNNMELPFYLQRQGIFPVISWVQAGDWSQIYETPILEADHYPCPVRCSKRTFLLKVRGMSMEPIFNDGELIFVDPDVEAVNGKYVIARLDDDNQATFKQLIVEDGHRFLKASNPDWPTPIQPINGNCTIVGVVISAMRLF